MITSDVGANLDTEADVVDHLLWIGQWLLENYQISKKLYFTQRDEFADTVILSATDMIKSAMLAWQPDLAARNGIVADSNCESYRTGAMQ